MARNPDDQLASEDIYPDYTTLMITVFEQET
jgi:hypothetical protein